MDTIIDIIGFCKIVLEAGFVLIVFSISGFMLWSLIRFFLHTYPLING